MKTFEEILGICRGLYSDTLPKEDLTKLDYIRESSHTLLDGVTAREIYGVKNLTFEEFKKLATGVEVEFCPDRGRSIARGVVFNSGGNKYIINHVHNGNQPKTPGWEIYGPCGWIVIGTHDFDFIRLLSSEKTTKLPNPLEKKNISSEIKNPFGDRCITLEEFKQLSHGDKVLFRNKQRTNQWANGTIYDGIGAGGKNYRYIISDSYEGASPKTEDWKKYGKFSWIVKDESDLGDVKVVERQATPKPKVSEDRFITLQEFRKLSPGDKVLFRNMQRTNQWVDGTIYDDGDDRFIITDSYDGASPTTDDWKKYGKFSWVVRSANDLGDVKVVERQTKVVEPQTTPKPKVSEDRFITLQEFRKLSPGDKVLFRNKQMTNRWANGTIYDDGSYRYIITDSYKGREANGTEWKKYGKFSWVVKNVNDLGDVKVVDSKVIETKSTTPDIKMAHTHPIMSVKEKQGVSGKSLGVLANKDSNFEIFRRLGVSIDSDGKIKSYQGPESVLNYHKPKAGQKVEVLSEVISSTTGTTYCLVQFGGNYSVINKENLS